MRIAIIGGGCSGITAAYKLDKKGYRNITLYEANDRIGGKVHSVNIDGHLFLYLNDAPGQNLFVGYQFDDALRSDEELDELVRRDITELGGTVGRIVARKAWKYFPHVKLQDLDVDYYPRLNALQGKWGTYYLGALFAFETTDHCARFADFIVNQSCRRLGGV